MAKSIEPILVCKCSPGIPEFQLLACYMFAFCLPCWYTSSTFICHTAILPYWTSVPFRLQCRNCQLQECQLHCMGCWWKGQNCESCAFLVPCAGFNVETITYKGINFTTWDVSGRSGIVSIFSVGLTLFFLCICKLSKQLEVWNYYATLVLP